MSALGARMKRRRSLWGSGLAALLHPPQLLPERSAAGFFTEELVADWNQQHPDQAVDRSIINVEDFKQAIWAYLTARPARCWRRCRLCWCLFSCGAILSRV